MPIKVESSHVITSYPILSVGNENSIKLDEGEVRTFYNPFSNLLDMVSYYLDIYKQGDIESLKEFVELQDYTVEAKFISNLDMYQCFVTSMYFSSFDPVENDEWMVFDTDKLDALLEESFFDEYNRTIKIWGKMCKRIYPMLDVYSFVKLQSYAAGVLPKDLLWDVNYIWTFEDLISIIYDLGWYDIISNVYKAYGVHWFANNGENDPIMYKWACYAVSACKKNGSIDDLILKHDLTNIYKELLIAFTIRNTIEENADIVNYVQECITNFDTERINGLVNHISSLKRENERLIDDKKQLNEGLTLLENQIRELQEDSNDQNYDKVEEIAQKICCLIPQDAEMNSKVEKFKVIWEKLDDSTKKDIKISISMFERFESFDLALFPMIRSLEHEFDRNFFSPFHCSKAYSKAKTSICKNRFYEKTHDALIKKQNGHPTMGNIPFIGKAMADVKAQESSELIKAFQLFLSDSRKAFISICKTLDNYKLGTQKHRLVDIRNGIAHGDSLVTKDVDKRCYEEVARLLYEPPMQILFELINASMKK